MVENNHVKKDPFIAEALNFLYFDWFPFFVLEERREEEGLIF